MGLVEGHLVFIHSQNVFCVGVFLGIENCEGGIVLYLSKCDNCVTQFVVLMVFMFLYVSVQVE
jgi:hypothetical protein